MLAFTSKSNTMRLGRFRSWAVRPYLHKKVNSTFLTRTCIYLIAYLSAYLRIWGAWVVAYSVLFSRTRIVVHAFYWRFPSVKGRWSSSTMCWLSSHYIPSLTKVSRRRIYSTKRIPVTYTTRRQFTINKNITLRFSRKKFEAKQHECLQWPVDQSYILREKTKSLLAYRTRLKNLYQSKASTKPFKSSVWAKTIHSLKSRFTRNVPNKNPKETYNVYKEYLNSISASENKNVFAKSHGYAQLHPSTSQSSIFSIKKHQLERKFSHRIRFYKANRRFIPRHKIESVKTKKQIRMQRRKQNTVIRSRLPSSPKQIRPRPYRRITRDLRLPLLSSRQSTTWYGTGHWLDMDSDQSKIAIIQTRNIKEPAMHQLFNTRVLNFNNRLKYYKRTKKSHARWLNRWKTNFNLGNAVLLTDNQFAKCKLNTRKKYTNYSYKFTTNSRWQRWPLSRNITNKMKWIRKSLSNRTLYPICKRRHKRKLLARRRYRIFGKHKRLHHILLNMQKGKCLMAQWAPTQLVPWIYINRNDTLVTKCKDMSTHITYGITSCKRPGKRRAKGTKQSKRSVWRGIRRRCVLALVRAMGLSLWKVKPKSEERKRHEAWVASVERLTKTPIMSIGLKGALASKAAKKLLTRSSFSCKQVQNLKKNSYKGSKIQNTRSFIKYTIGQRSWLSKEYGYTNITEGLKFYESLRSIKYFLMSQLPEFTKRYHERLVIIKEQEELAALRNKNRAKRGYYSKAFLRTKRGNKRRGLETKKAIYRESKQQQGEFRFLTASMRNTYRQTLLTVPVPFIFGILKASNKNKYVQYTQTGRVLTSSIYNQTLRFLTARAWADNTTSSSNRTFGFLKNVATERYNAAGANARTEFPDRFSRFQSTKSVIYEHLLKGEESESTTKI